MNNIISRIKIESPEALHPDCDTIICMPVQDEPLFSQGLCEPSLQNAELGLLKVLLFLANQIDTETGDFLNPDSYEVFIVVNNSQQDVDENNAVFQNNQKTLRFLRALEARNEDTIDQIIREEPLDIRDAYQHEYYLSLVKSLQESLKIRVLDKSSDGLAFPTCNVGIARDYAGKEAANLLIEAGRPNGLVMQADADVAYSKGYIYAFRKAFFANPDLAVAGGKFTPIHLTPCPETAEFDTLTSIDDLCMSVRQMALRVLQSFPQEPKYFGFGGASLVTTASKYLQAGGVPHISGAEDHGFAWKLRQLGDHKTLNDVSYFVPNRFSARVAACCGWGHIIRTQASNINQCRSTLALEAELTLQEVAKAGLPYEQLILARPDLAFIPQQDYDFLVANSDAKERPDLDPERHLAYLDKLMHGINPLIDAKHPRISPKQAFKEAHAIAKQVLNEPVIDFSEAVKFHTLHVAMLEYIRSIAKIFDGALPELPNCPVNKISARSVAKHIAQGLDVGDMNSLTFKNTATALWRHAKSLLSKWTFGLVKEDEDQRYRSYLRIGMASIAFRKLFRSTLPDEKLASDAFDDLTHFASEHICPSLVVLSLADGSPEKACHIFGQIEELSYGCEDESLRKLGYLSYALYHYVKKRLNPNEGKDA